MGQVNSVTNDKAPEGPATALAKPRDPRLWKAAGDFQEVMLSQFTQSMRTTESDSELFEECPGARLSTRCSATPSPTRCRSPAQWG